MVSKYKFKIVCGYRKDQEHTIDANEVHKAYFLFTNPEKKALFSNGLAVRGSDIQRIVPDYHATMGWNAGYNLTPADYEEIERSGVGRKMDKIAYMATEIARNGKPTDFGTPLLALVRGKYKALEKPLNQTLHEHKPEIKRIA